MSYNVYSALLLLHRRSVTSSLAIHIPIEAAINQEAVAAYKEREAKRQKLKEEQVCQIHVCIALRRDNISYFLLELLDCCKVKLVVSHITNVLCAVGLFWLLKPRKCNSDQTLA